MYDERPTLTKRVLRAVWAFVVNFVMWILVPALVAALITGRVANTPLMSSAFIYEFGALFIILDVGAAFFKGTAVSVPFLSAASLLAAVYLWLVTSGGDIIITAAGLDIGLEFRVLLYIIILPSIWGIVKSPLSYFVWRRAR